MSGEDALHARLASAASGPDAADRICEVCVELLQVDGAAISLVHAGQPRGTLGASGALSRRLDAYQFTYGEGPCLEAVRTSAPVMVPDADDPGEVRWPAFTAALLQAGVRAVFALPITIAAEGVGALDLFRSRPGALSGADLRGGLVAAQLACLPVLALAEQAELRASAGVEEGGLSDPWEEVASLERVEVYQATGMLIAQLDVGPAEALLRLRARAFTTGQTASDVAAEILERRLSADRSGTWVERPAAGEA